jgi:GNAT superfamily N-acetyltransferase
MAGINVGPGFLLAVRMNGDLKLLSGGAEMIGQIEGMWRKLTLHAAHHSEHFSQYFEQRTFEQRRKELQEKVVNGRLHIDIARDARSGQDLGYCVSSMDAKGAGEIESLFVDDISRGRGVGNALIQGAIEWMEQNGAKSIVVFTVYGSEEVLPFYARYGFQPKMLLLERKK